MWWQTRGEDHPLPVGISITTVSFSNAKVTTISEGLLKDGKLPPPFESGLLARVSADSAGCKQGVDGMETEELIRCSEGQQRSGGVSGKSQVF